MRPTQSARVRARPHRNGLLSRPSLRSRTGLSPTSSPASESRRSTATCATQRRSTASRSTGCGTSRGRRSPPYSARSSSIGGWRVVALRVCFFVRSVGYSRAIFALICGLPATLELHGDQCRVYRPVIYCDVLVTDLLECIPARRRYQDRSRAILERTVAGESATARQCPDWPVAHEIRNGIVKLEKFLHEA